MQRTHGGLLDTLIGRTLSHYRIIDRVGAGGMGVVYRAHDTRLDRDVAVKVLPHEALADESARKRFRREAHSISRLNHPYIAAVYDFDSEGELDFLVMELVQGQTLAERIRDRGALTEREALRLGVEVAEALQAAHEGGVTHRDLKPGNIMVTPQGHAKVLDFGLARRLGTGPGMATMSTLTETQDVAGTLPYMAPEQLLGGEADPRTDIYALGVVLFEMVTGRRPFEGGTSIALVNAILNATPDPPRRIRPGHSPALERIILKCLERRPEARPASARELAGELQRATGALPAQGAFRPGAALPTVLRRARRAAPAIAGVAVLLAAVWLAASPGSPLRRLGRPRIGSLGVVPFTGVLGDTLEQYLVDGVASELSARLSGIRSLRVLSSDALHAYGDSTTSVARVASAVRADALLKGSVRRTQDVVRIEAMLVAAPSGKTLWTATVERPIAGVSTLIDTMALQVARATGARVTREEASRLERANAINPAAHEEYLRGQFYLGDRISEEGHRRALDHFSAAIRIDPLYAPGWAGLAKAYWSLSNAYIPAKVAMPEAAAAAAKALELDPDLPAAHAILGVIRSQYDWEWASAEWEIRRAIQLKPSDAETHFYYAQLLTETGHLREALTEFTRAKDLDLLNPGLQGWEAMGYYYLGRYGEAITRFQKWADADTGCATPHYSLGLCYTAEGEHDRAIAELLRARELQDVPAVRALLAYAYASAGKRAEALDIVQRVSEAAPGSQAPAFFIAVAYTALGDKDRALQWLEKAFDNRDEEVAWLNVDPKLESIRGDRRFKDLVRRMRLPESR